MRGTYGILDMYDARGQLTLSGDACSSVASRSWAYETGGPLTRHEPTVHQLRGAV